MMDWRDKFIEKLFALDARKLDINGAYAFKHKHLPSALFKYRNCDPYAFANLRNDSIWLADPKTLNDPYDCSHYIDQELLEAKLYKQLPSDLFNGLEPAIRDELERSLLASSDPRSAMIDLLLPEVNPKTREELKSTLAEAIATRHDDFMKHLSDRVKDSFKLCSFSERVDSSLMWAHYAKNHTGFCIEYDVQELAPDDYRARFMYPIIYSDKVFDATDHVSNDVHLPSFNNLRLSLAGLIKASDWSYEKEWRLLFMSGVLPSSRAYPMPRPKRVYLGSHIDSDDQLELLSICGSLKIDVLKMRHAASEFRMEAVPVSVADRPKYVPRR